jgi:hypothetical protein
MVGACACGKELSSSIKAGIPSIAQNLKGLFSMALRRSHVVTKRYTKYFSYDKKLQIS